MKITVVEKWKDKVYMTNYKFNKEEEKNQFIMLCEQSDCLIIERKEKQESVS